MHLSGNDVTSLSDKALDAAYEASYRLNPNSNETAFYAIEILERLATVQGFAFSLWSPPFPKYDAIQKTLSWGFQSTEVARSEVKKSAGEVADKLSVAGKFAALGFAGLAIIFVVSKLKK